MAKKNKTMKVVVELKYIVPEDRCEDPDTGKKITDLIKIAEMEDTFLNEDHNSLYMIMESFHFNVTVTPVNDKKDKKS